MKSSDELEVACFIGFISLTMMPMAAWSLLMKSCDFVSFINNKRWLSELPEGESEDGN